MRKIDRIETPVGIAFVIGAIIGAFSGGVGSAVVAGASLAVVTMVVVSVYNLMAR